jgi:hypothetical protein
VPSQFYRRKRDVRAHTHGRRADTGWRGRKRIYMSAVTPDLYPMYQPKIVAVLAYRDPTKRIVYDNYMTVR